MIIRKILSPVFLSVAMFITAPALAGGWLGVTIEPPQGVQIGEIIKGGPADKAELLKGDIITKINGNKVYSVASFTQKISQIGAEKKVTLDIMRQGKPLTIEVILDDSSRHRSVSQTPFFQSPPNGAHSIPFLPPGHFQPPAYQNSNKFPPIKSKADAQPAVWLGIAPGVAKSGEVVIKGVAANGPGDKAGLKAGDLIISINGQAVVSPASLIKMISNFKPGDLVILAITRKGQDKSIQIKMAAHPTAK
ncbi:MAG: PDZ domain-containing protein [Magnetococcales bacterium]|nr:PDZ domain-containing protein [Magnetococcales bacterium]